jgi:hypothetical protein
MRSKFTPENRGALIRATVADRPLRDTCQELGLHHDTVRGWLKRGRREQSGPYFEFALAVDLARERCRLEAAEPMDQQGLLEVTSQAARTGSVQAMKLLWEMLRAGPGRGEEPADPLDELDELAARRAARA